MKSVFRKLVSLYNDIPKLGKKVIRSQILIPGNKSLKNVDQSRILCGSFLGVEPVPEESR